jgi:tetratricopeptide (TPR) repeat protein
LIKAAAAAGLLLSALVCAALIILALRPEGNPAPGGSRFRRLLRDYDRIFEAGEQAGDSGGRPETLDAMLDKIEKSAQGVESWLSLLKRRRALAKAHPQTLSQYREAGRRAAAAFPWSEPLAALALANSLPGTAESRDYGALINDSRLIPLALAAAVLRGDFNSPGLAALNRGESLLSLGLPLIRSGFPGDRGDRLIVNLALLKILRQDYLGAEAQLQGLSRAAGQGAFLGEYYYDFGDPLRAAEIFSRAGGEGALLRSAEALWLGGRRENAGNIWRTLSGAGQAGPEARLRSLYNLGVSFPEEGEKWFGLLYQAGEENPALRGNPSYVYGLISHTRNLGPREALELLDSRLRGLDSPAALRDLEILRRRGEFRTPEQTTAEAWLLLGAYPEDPRLYRWAAWYFGYQRRREDAAILVKTAGYRGIRDPWLDLSAALNDLEAGRLDEAEEGLRSIISQSARPIWQAEANLGLIMETRSPAEALKHYEAAAGGVEDRRAASRLHQRIAGCLRILGQKEESRRALLRSLDLDPDNLRARLELRRPEEE